MKAKSVYLYTDGSSLGNPGPGGYGIILEWVGMSYVKEFSGGFARTTNNRMELLAVIIGLELLKKPGMEVIVYSDSKYVVDAVEKKMGFWLETKSVQRQKKQRFMEAFFKNIRKTSSSFSMGQRA